ncbi:hypothetical protein CQY20_26425 [Mycolicibacterium agri]|uniref:Uncharacterized protein n=1 Tax=Mycolicibacterium agri TaxID=36811 RepID=A0A2A7MRW2_MYCAG|nr:hypothetical protein [Mycolicibacterium agri]PEG34290.1 hypothetical protein CQY20_26425 [Mycolicibacterium agri]GFG53136.1 hypothetical protein MAGR_45770 [Mycolicibacterium agri]
MIKTAIVAMIAAGTLSVPLAGIAWAAPGSDSSEASDGIGQVGVPTKLGTFAGSGIKPKPELPPDTPTLNPSGAPTPPGKVFISEAAKAPGANTPDAMGQLESQIWSTYTLADGTVIPSDPDEWGQRYSGPSNQAVDAWMR